MGQLAPHMLDNLRTVVAKEEIRAVLDLYPHYIVSQDAKALAELFAPDGVLDCRDLARFSLAAQIIEQLGVKSLRLEGREAIAAFFTKTWPAEVRAFFSNRVIDVHQGQAYSVAFFHQRARQGDEPVISAGRMLAQLSLKRKQWKIVLMRPELFHFVRLRDGWVRGDGGRVKPCPPEETPAWVERLLQRQSPGLAGDGLSTPTA